MRVLVGYLKHIEAGDYRRITFLLDEQVNVHITPWLRIKESSKRFLTTFLAFSSMTFLLDQYTTFFVPLVELTAKFTSNSFIINAKIGVNARATSLEGNGKLHFLL